MFKLIDDTGHVQYGLFPQPVDLVNYPDYPLETPMGWPIGWPFKHFMFNQFHFLGIIGPKVMCGMAVVDLKKLTNGFFYVYDRGRNKLFEANAIAPPSRKTFITPTPRQPQSHFQSRKLEIRFEGNHILAASKGISFEGCLDLDETHPLRLCSRAGYKGWVYTQKTAPVPLTGNLTFNGQTLAIEAPQYQALIDWTGGFMRRETFWNWAASACLLDDGRTLGVNLACGVNETGITENAFWIDGRMTKVDMVQFSFDSADLYQPWRIRSFDERVDLTFYPESHRGENVNALLLASRFTQLMGCFTGRLVTAEGETLPISHCPGWAEDHYAKW